MKIHLLLLVVTILLVGCSATPQAELDAKIDVCTKAGMGYTYLKDYRNRPFEVVCVREHPNEK